MLSIGGWDRSPSDDTTGIVDPSSDPSWDGMVGRAGAGGGHGGMANRPHSGRVTEWGSGGRAFESLRPDQYPEHERGPRYAAGSLLIRGPGSEQAGTRACAG